MKLDHWLIRDAEPGAAILAPGRPLAAAVAR